jgi:GNAT superfamily N-acetyltransferase
MAKTFAWGQGVIDHGIRARDTFRWESLAALRDEGLAEIIAKHWDEVGVHKDDVPLAIDWERYHKLEKDGILRLMAARRAEKLVGYASFLVLPHLHYSTTLHAMNDAIYVDPSVRGIGIKLIRAAEKLLAELARPRPVRILYHAKLHVEEERGTLARVFEALGYKAFETSHDKVVRA